MSVECRTMEYQMVMWKTTVPEKSGLIGKFIELMSKSVGLEYTQFFSELVQISKA